MGIDLSQQSGPDTWPVEGIDQVLAFLPIIESPDFIPATWPKLDDRIVDGKRVTPMPYPEYNPVVDQLWNTFSQSGGFVHPYDALPEDPTEDGVTFSVLGAHFPPEYFQTATLNQVRRYLVLCSRGERFCDGHIESEFQSGSVVAALRRLHDLRKTM